MVYLAPIIKLRARIYKWSSVNPRLGSHKDGLRALNILIFVGFICALVGGSWTDPKSDHISDAFNLRRAGAILVLIAVALTIFPNAISLIQIAHPHEASDPILVQVVLVLPLFLIRSIYLVIQWFIASAGAPGHNTWVYFGLLTLMDFMSLVIFTFVGLSRVHGNENHGAKTKSVGTVETPIPSPEQPQFQQPSLQQAQWQPWQQWPPQRSRRHGGIIPEVFEMIFGREEEYDMGGNTRRRRHGGLFQLIFDTIFGRED